ncbi:MAG: type II secretion system protein GspE [Firmicutes bacterium]|nr:type II secretion system protein GspE [Bacillota bacterium]
MVNISYTKKLGQLLIDNNLLTVEQLNQALDEQKQTKEKLGHVLVRWKLVSEHDIKNILERHFNIKRAEVPKNLPTELLQIIPEHIVRRHKVFPIGKDEDILMVAMVDPLNMVVIDELQQVTKCKVNPLLAPVQQIDTAIARYFEARQLENESRLYEGNNSTYNIGGEEDNSTVARLVNTILDQAVFNLASDVHIEPREDCVMVRERVDGILRELMTLHQTTHSLIVSRIKILANLDIAEKRLPQDGRFIYQDQIDLRISTMPTVYGEKVVIRILQKKPALMDINKLGFSDSNIEALKKLIKSSHGMVLLTGPTSSGKTTTLYAMLNQLNSPEKNIVTIEDPVEYTIKGINQIQVNNRTGLDFATGLRSILRQDPDIIMVGEIRDSETAQIAARSANTGQLVLCTMHTNDSASAVTRLVDMGIPSYLVASVLIGVVSQRLVRNLCPDCRKTYDLQSEMAEFKLNKGTPLYQGKGCINCGQTGYSGRMGIHEILIANKDIKELIHKNASTDIISKIAIENGMITLKQDGVKKAVTGLTTIEEISKATYSVDNNPT